MKRTLLIATAVASSTVLAACGSMGEGRYGDKQQRQAMHQAAIAACEGKAEGDKVTLKGMHGDMAALCMKSPKHDDGKLHAMPEQMMAMFKAAKEACIGKAEGDAVQFKGKDNQPIDATCKKHDDELFAHPNHHGMGQHDRMMEPPVNQPKP